jgi:hypothetical protein
MKARINLFTLSLLAMLFSQIAHADESIQTGNNHISNIENSTSALHESKLIALETLEILGISAVGSLNPKAFGGVLLIASPIVGGMATDAPSSKMWQAIAVGGTTAAWGIYNYSELSMQDRYSYNAVFQRNAAIMLAIFGIGLVQENYKSSQIPRTNFQAIPTSTGIEFYLSKKF